MNEQLIKFIELCLMDGVISDKEREVIFRKSKELGVPEDECEIILEGMTQKKEGKISEMTSTHENKQNGVREKFEVKKVKKVKDLEFNQKDELEKKIKKITLLISESNDYIKEHKNHNQKLKIKISENKKTLKESVINTIKSVKKRDKFNLGGFKFEVDELIKKTEINSYLELHGSLEYGEFSREFNPEYPHPISFLYNHVKLGETILDGNTYLSGYMKYGSFNYFKSEPIKTFDLKKEKPNKILIFKKKDELKYVMLIFDETFKLLELKYSFSLKKIDYEKSFGSYKDSSKSYYHTFIKVDYSEIDVYKDLVL